MSYNDAINYLYGLQKHGIKLGLDNISKLLSYFDNPQTGFSSIHVAGTNGKGSTAAMIASILEAAGLKVGLFTSPHLVSFTERIRINDEQITESEVVSLTEEIKLKVESLKLKVKSSTFQPSPLDIFEPTFFEVVTAMAFLYFKRKNVDWAVIETGMGGRLDATNVITPEVSVITSIGCDHKEFLGDTISAIAGEKAGIIKKGVPVVTASQEPEVMDIIEKKADEKSSPLFICGKDFNGILKLSDINGITFDYAGNDCTIKNVFVPLAGEHQLFNACLAIKTSMIALQRAEEQKSRRAEGKNCRNLTSELPRFQTSALKEGLANTRWHGRLELISDNPPILIDGAHNPSASATLADSLRNNFLKTYRRIILIMGIMADKDINGVMAPLLPLALETILTAPAYERAASPEKLAECASAMGYQNIHIAQTVRDAIEMATNLSAANGHTPPQPPLIKGGIEGGVNSELRTLASASRPRRPNSSLILITGSFYTIGEAKEALGEKGILSRLRE